MLSSLPEEFELLDRDSDKAGQKRSWVSNMPHFHFCTCKWMTEKMGIVFLRRRCPQIVCQVHSSSAKTCKRQGRYVWVKVGKLRATKLS